MSTAGTLRGVIRKSVMSVLYVTVNCARSRCSCHSRCTGRRARRTAATLALLPCCSTSLCALPFRLCNCSSTPAQSLRTHRPAAVLRRQEQTLCACLARAQQRPAPACPSHASTRAQLVLSFIRFQNEEIQWGKKAKSRDAARPFVVLVPLPPCLPPTRDRLVPFIDACTMTLSRLTIFHGPSPWSTRANMTQTCPHRAFLPNSLAQ